MNDEIIIKTRASRPTRTARWIVVTGHATGAKISLQVQHIAAIGDPDPALANAPTIQLSMGGSISVRETRTKIMQLIAEAT